MDYNAGKVNFPSNFREESEQISFQHYRLCWTNSERQGEVSNTEIKCPLNQYSFSEGYCAANTNHVSVITVQFLKLYSGSPDLFLDL